MGLRAFAGKSEAEIRPSSWKQGNYWEALSQIVIKNYPCHKDNRAAYLEKGDEAKKKIDDAVSFDIQMKILQKKPEDYVRTGTHGDAPGATFGSQFAGSICGVNFW